MGGFSSENINYRNPMQPQVQQPMGGFPGQPQVQQPGMGQQGLPSGMMQHIQQLQQQMPPMQPQVQQPARQLSPVRQYLNAMQQYRQGGRQGVRPTYAQFKQPQPGQQLNGMGQVVQPQYFGIAGGGTGMPPIGQPMSDPFKPQISGGPIGMPLGGMPPIQPMSDPFQPQISGGPVGQPVGGFGNIMDRVQQVQQIMGQQPGMSAIGGGQPMSDPFKPQISGGPVGMPLGGMPPIQPTSDPFKPQISGGPVGQPMGVAGGVGTPPQPNQPPMPMKKGGFAAKPVWDKERPEDLNKPKSLSVKKKKAAKARAKAAGRPYPNLVDNMAAARKKGK
jgi:hypothetical protein